MYCLTFRNANDTPQACPFAHLNYFLIQFFDYSFFNEANRHPHSTQKLCNDPIQA